MIKNHLPLSKVESDPVVLLVHWQGKSQSEKQIVNVGVCALKNGNVSVETDKWKKCVSVTLRE